ncbi:archease [Methanothermococcus sp.]|uniref:archease n=1 Tax=Methanothermococcus sp. TaxID=2614238 RepID=UPI0025EDD705|nr:archease [Methanothermococcus sp.]
MFEYFETMADMGIIARGKTLEEAFKESAKALSNLMVNIDTVEKKIKREIEIVSEDLYSLLYDFLTELLIIMDSEYLIFSDFDIKIYKKENKQKKMKENNENNENEKEEEYILKCVAYGEKLDKEKHEPKEEVKAITYHKMEIKKENNEYVIKYIVDL